MWNHLYFIQEASKAQGEGGTFPGSHSWCVEGSSLRQVTLSPSQVLWSRSPPPQRVHRHLGHLLSRGWSHEADAVLCRESLGLAPTLITWNSLLQSLQCLPMLQTFQRRTRTPPAAESPRKLAAWLKQAQTFQK